MNYFIITLQPKQTLYTNDMNGKYQNKITRDQRYLEYYASLLNNLCDSHTYYTSPQPRHVVNQIHLEKLP
jgi:hypothetical protein